MVEKKKVLGIDITYKSKPLKSGCVSTYLLSSIKTDGKSKGEYFYINGILSDIPYCKIDRNTVFAKTDKRLDYSKILKYCIEFNVSTTIREIEDDQLISGRNRIKKYQEDNKIKYVRNL